MSLNQIKTKFLNRMTYYEMKRKKMTQIKNSSEFISVRFCEATPGPFQIRQLYCRVCHSTVTPIQYYTVTF